MAEATTTYHLFEVTRRTGVEESFQVFACSREDVGETIQDPEFVPDDRTFTSREMNPRFVATDRWSVDIEGDGVSNVYLGDEESWEARARMLWGAHEAVSAEMDRLQVQVEMNVKVCQLLISFAENTWDLSDD